MMLPGTLVRINSSDAWAPIYRSATSVEKLTFVGKMLPRDVAIFIGKHNGDLLIVCNRIIGWVPPTYMVPLSW